MRRSRLPSYVRVGASVGVAALLASCSDAEMKRSDQAVDRAADGAKHAVHRTAPAVEHAAASAVENVDRLAVKAGRAADKAGASVDRAGHRLDRSVRDATDGR